MASLSNIVGVIVRPTFINKLFDNLIALPFDTRIARYTYDAEGKRVRRNAQGQDVWMVYGAGGELVAEYTSSGTAAPKEYGYRDGQLLITASPNYDAQAQSSLVVHLYQTILNRTPSPAEVQGWLNQGLTNVDAFKSVARQMFDSPEYSYRYRTDREFVYDCYAAYLYREPDQGGWDFWTGLVPQYGRASVRDDGFASSQEFADRVASALAGETLWLTADQLGTPRIINDASGSLANVKRHDYLPFGEELTTQGGRTQQQGYVADSVRQKFGGGHERDDESGLDFMQARYYASVQGRFTSPDSFGGRLTNPQTLNLYAYVLNNPLKWVDPTGHRAQDPNKEPTNDDPEFWNTEDTPATFTSTTSIDKDKPIGEQGIGEPGTIGQWVPIYGNGRHAINDFQTGHPYRGAFHTAMAVSDVFIVKSLAFSVGRYGFSLLAEKAAAKVIVEDALVESGVEVGEAASELPEVIYRGGNPSPSNLTPRTVDNGSLSFRDSLSNPYPLEPGQQPVFGHGDSYFGVDTTKLPSGSVIPDNIPPGHVSVKGASPSVLKDAVTIRGKFPK